MDQLLFFVERKRILKEQFQKLKDEFLTEEQSSIVELREKPDYYWPIYRSWSGGFTETNWKIEKGCVIGIDWIHVYICLPQQKDLGALLLTIAHEFAHVYLAFNNLDEYHDGSPEHNRYKNYFFEYLVKNFKKNSC